MPIYKITTPAGDIRVVEANVQRAALNHVVKSDYQVEALSAVQLSHLLREHDVTIEQVTPTVKDEAKADIEEVADEAEEGEDNGDEE